MIARWHDAASGQTRKIERQVADEGPSRTIREVFQNQNEATKAAEAKAAELKAGEGELTVTLVGDPTARAEAPVQVFGVGEDGRATTEVEAEYGKEEEDRKEDDKPSSQTGSGEYVSVLDRP